jgi:hypothetical protein
VNAASLKRASLLRQASSSVTRRFGKNCQIIGKSSQNSCPDKKMPKYQHPSSIFESPKHFQQNTLETLKYLLQTMF